VGSAPASAWTSVTSGSGRDRGGASPVLGDTTDRGCFFGDQAHDRLFRHEVTVEGSLLKPASAQTSFDGQIAESCFAMQRHAASRSCRGGCSRCSPAALHDTQLSRTRPASSLAVRLALFSACNRDAVERSEERRHEADRSSTADPTAEPRHPDAVRMQQGVEPAASPRCTKASLTTSVRPVGL